MKEYLTELVRILDKKEKYRYHDRDDIDNYGIRDIENLFSEVYEKDYYKYLCMHILFLLKIQEKLTLFMYAVIMQTLSGIMKQIMLLKNFLNLF